MFMIQQLDISYTYSTLPHNVDAFNFILTKCLCISVTYLLDAPIGVVDDGYEEVGNAKDEQDDEGVEVK